MSHFDDDEDGFMDDDDMDEGPIYWLLQIDQSLKWKEKIQAIRPDLVAYLADL